ncbi:MAG: DEAD/DEAH box helicase family protein, partial [Clostridiales bacterium]|nr:DEAD/DEAH box helicase family protein [Clostridiales bacterium]
MFELRQYQSEAKDAILSEWSEGHRKTLLVLPTGTGKTIVFASVADNQVHQGHRVLIMAHRGELLDQAADKLRDAAGLDSVLEKEKSTSLG